MSLIATALALALICGTIHFANADEGTRILNIKECIIAKDDVIRLKDIVSNTGMLTEEERDYEITDTPKTSQTVLSIVDLAYLFQRHESLMNVRLRGPKNITLKRIKSTEYLEKARREILEFVKSNPPWKDWEIDMLLNSSDELSLSRAGAFESLEVKSYENKGMLGPVALSVTLLDNKKKQIEKLTVTPVILRKVDVIVINNNGKIGEKIKKEDLRKVPIWVGGDKKDYVMEENKCVGYELARNISSGDMLHSADILRPVCAKKGDLIWIECKSGALSVRMAATAMENGREGDSVKVMNNSSNKIFSVELTGEKEGVHRI